MKRLLELPLDDPPKAACSARRTGATGCRLSATGGSLTWLTVTREWRVLEDEGRKVLEHSTVFTSCLRAGDGTWGDFTLEFDVRQMRPQADTSMDEMFNTKGRVGRDVPLSGLPAGLRALPRMPGARRACVPQRRGLDPAGRARDEVDPGEILPVQGRVRGGPDSRAGWTASRCSMSTDSTFRRGRMALLRQHPLPLHGFL